MMNFIKLFLTVLTVPLVCESAKILGFVPTPSYSHQVAFHPIWKELSLRGHEVTTVTTDPIKDPALTNLTEIDVHASYENWNKKVSSITNSSMLSFFFSVADMMIETAHFQLTHPEVQKLIYGDNKFDLVMVEYGIVPAHAFAKKFNAPLIVITSVDAFSDIRKVMGSPTHPIVYPDPMIPINKNSSLSQRVLIVMFNLYAQVLLSFYYIPIQQSLIDQYFGKNFISVKEMLSETSLILANSDPIFHGVKPLLPTIVQFGGGTHRTSPKPLPTDLKKVLNAAENGFIYFSLGSNVKSKDLSEETCKIIIDAFAELPYTVLWKFEKDTLPNKPKNVVIRKWLPQQDILKHPNIKLFITQGGLQSIDEAIYDHVPMLGMPFFADQEFNVNNMVEKEFGLYINYKTMNKEELKKAVLEMISNSKYKRTLKRLAELALDQPMTGLERAVWWTEYVIRHNGTKHLRSPALDIPFYQYYLLDVFAVLVSIFVVLVCVMVYIIKLFKMILKSLLPSKIKNE